MPHKIAHNAPRQADTHFDTVWSRLGPCFGAIFNWGLCQETIQASAFHDWDGLTAPIDQGYPRLDISLREQVQLFKNQSVKLSCILGFLMPMARAKGKVAGG